MGGCVSSESIADQKPSANVVSITGELRQFPLPTTVSDVLQSLTLASDSFFLCNSDRLYFDDYIPSLHPHDVLESAQIYFVLPNNKLQYRLAASDMAALAVKASVALQQINASMNRRGCKKRRTRISPVLVSEEDPQSNHTVNYRKSYYSVDADRKNAAKSPAPLGVSRSNSVKKLTRYSSQRAKLAVRSFKLKLTTIYEGSVLHPSL